MDKQLWTGPAGCGKTHRMLEAFVERLKAAPDPLEFSDTILLPTAEHTERILSLVIQKGIPGIFHQRITTLSRFLQHILPPSEAEPVTNVTRFLILRDILAAEEWPFFQDLARTPGLVHAVASMIAELKESLITVETFRERMNHLKTLESDFAVKYETLARIYELYEAERKQRGLSEPQDWILEGKKIRFSGSGRAPATIWLDGFIDFSASQLACLEALAEAAGSLVVTLTLDPAPERDGLFRPVKRTEEILLARGFRPVVFGRPGRRACHPALAYLEQHLFSYAPGAALPKAPDPGGALQIMEAVGVQGEMELIARDIKRQYRRGECRYGDFAVLFRQVAPYESLIRSVFQQYEIPVEIHERSRLKASGLVRTVVHLLRIFTDGWKREDVFDFFKSSYFRNGLGAGRGQAVPELENEVFRLGLREGRESWLEADSLPETGRGWIHQLVSVEDELRSVSSLTVLKQVLEKAIRSTFRLYPEDDEASETVRREAVCYRRLCGLMDEVAFHVSGQKVGFDIFADRLLRLIDIDLYSLHYRDKNRVHVYGVSIARQKEYRFVYVGGLLEKGFPLQTREDPLLGDWERRLFNAGQEAVLKERLPRQDMERTLFYTAVTRARERLVLSCPRLDLEGRESLPSFYLEEVRELFHEVPTVRQNLSRPYPSPAEAVNRRDLETGVVGTLWNDETRGEEDQDFLLALTNRLLEGDAFRGKIEACAGRVEARLRDPRILEQNLFSAWNTSATRLEEFGKCPYRYFAGRVLELRDPQEDMNARHKGSILHGVLENFFEAWLKDPALGTVPEKRRQRVLEELSKAARQYPLSFEKPYQQALAQAEMEEMILAFVEHETERLQHAALRPARMEFSFGTGPDADAPPLELRQGEKVLSLKGKIDRVDQDAEKRVSLVLDYKRRAGYKKDDLAFGTALQLPLYLKAVQHFLGLEPMAGELYSIMDCRKKGFSNEDLAAQFGDAAARTHKLNGKEFAALLERTVDYAFRYSREMEAGRIEVEPRSCETFCPFPAVCRIEKWRLPLIEEEIRRREHLDTSEKEGAVS